MIKDITPYLRSGVLFNFQGSIKRREEVTPDGRLSDLIIQFSLSKAYLSFFCLAGLRAVAHLWQEFVLEMRYRWENDIFIPRYSGKKITALSEVTPTYQIYNLFRSFVRGEITQLEL